MPGSLGAMYDQLHSAIEDVFPRVRADLERLVAIPSISVPGFDPGPVRDAAIATAGILEESGFAGVRLLEIAGAHPAVFGEIPGPDGAPTVLLYAHHDVQPGGDLAEWDSDPFTPVVRDGRMYGRGTSDDKCGIAIHAGAARLLDGSTPVNVKVFIEGEEEIGSLHLTKFLDTYGDLLGADVVVISDSANWDVGAPALTTSLRGLVDCVIEVRTLDSGVHSGMFGGAVPDALSVLVRALATLHDERGRVAVPGLAGDDSGTIEYPEGDLRIQAGMRPGVDLIGDGSVASRLWSRPAVAVLAIDAPRLGEAINQLVPVARAKVSMRIAPGQDPEAAMRALTGHLEEHVPWGAAVTVTPGAAAPAFRFDASGPGHRAFRTGLREAWGRAAVDIGTGGSIPIVPELQATFPGAEIVLTGAADPLSAAHGPNESVSLGELQRSTLAEAIALHALAGR